MTDELGVYWDGEEPLKRIDSETASAHKALLDYAHMGHIRSLRKLAEKYQDEENPPTKHVMTLTDWSRKHAWQDRVHRFDDIERQYEEMRWRERKDELRKKEWDNFDRLQSIITEILDAVPSFIRRRETITDKGSPKVISQDGKIIQEGRPAEKVITLKLDANAAIKFIRTASDIGRRAAEMDKDDLSKIMKELDFDKLSPEQIQRVAAGEHLLDVLGVRK